ncbi:hypothetical protein J8L88_14815 [Aquimarina sp. MMG015]|nr:MULTISPECIES: hypothetical protein [unclassified Aquimarina]AXT54334.1 hypothetical protein D1815_00720 [Aquimarina sp. AD1]MBQ4804132.1 hypothetical protein [Aquimarina sp. MMG015]
MKIQFKFLVNIFLFLFLLNSCDNQEDSNNDETIGLEIHQEDQLEGKKELNGFQIAYKVVEKSNYYTVKVAINDVRLVASIDYDTEFIEIDGKNVVLSSKEKETLLMIGEEISAYLFKDGSVDDFTMAEFTLLKLLEYWAKSPSNYSYEKIVFKGNQTNLVKGNDDGITCIRKNTYVTAVYDDNEGQIYRDRELVNGDRCLGRCGSGCPGVFSIASAWTKDCLDHDQCGRVLGGSTNPFDRNCGDEYAQAADDFLFGVLRGCRG